MQKFYKFILLSAMLSALAAVVVFSATPVLAFDGSVINSSYNWAGYVARNGTFTGVSGVWTVPSVSNTITSAANAEWVGIGGASSDDLIQAGTEAIVSPSGSVQYQVWYELLPSVPKSIPLTVNAGDVMNVSIARQQSGAWLITWTNQTTEQNYQARVNYNSSLSSAEWIEEMPKGIYNQIYLDNFTPVQFSSGTAIENGNAVSIAESGAGVMNMYDMTGTQNLATASAINSDGQSFSVTRSAGSNYQAPAYQVAPTVSYSNPGINWQPAQPTVQVYIPQTTSRTSVRTLRRSLRFYTIGYKIGLQFR